MYQEDLLFSDYLICIGTSLEARLSTYSFCFSEENPTAQFRAGLPFRRDRRRRPAAGAAPAHQHAPGGQLWLPRAGLRVAGGPGGIGAALGGRDEVCGGVGETAQGLPAELQNVTLTEVAVKSEGCNDFVSL